MVLPSVSLSGNRTLTVTLSRLLVQPYYVRVGCNNPGSTASSTNAIGPWVASVPSYLSPLPPAITSVDVPVGKLSTGGNQVVNVYGLQLGRVLGSTVSITLTNSRGATFNSSACAVMVDLVAVTCRSPAGVGSGLSVTLTVDDVSSAAFNASLSYERPTILSLSGLGANSAPTTGGTVVITGQNFGPVHGNAVDAVVYTPSGMDVTFPAHCVVTKADSELTCDTHGGVGGTVLWTVTIGGLSSSNPRTGYRPPVIHRIGVYAANDVDVAYDPVALNALETRGSQWLRIDGDYFGSTGLAVDVVLTGRGVVGSNTSLSLTAACVVVTDHVTARCGVPVGVGTGFSWVLAVAGQSSLPSTTTTSYAPPSVLAVYLSDAIDGNEGTSTTGGAVVTVYGDNYGMDEGAVHVTWDGVAVPAAVSIPYAAVSFTSLASNGGSAVVTVSVGGQPVVASPLLTVQYRAPTITTVVLDTDGASSTPLDCSNAAVPVSAGVSNTSLQIVGADFGVGGRTSVTVGGVPAAVDRSRSDHGQLFVTTAMCYGNIVVTVAGKASVPASYLYRSLVALPEITSVSPQHGPASGGTLLTISGRQFQVQGVVTFLDPLGALVGTCDVPSIANAYTPTHILYVLGCEATACLFVSISQWVSSMRA